MSADAVSVERRLLPEVSRFARIATVGSLAVGTYMAALDNSIVNAVLPVVSEAFHTNLSSVEWVVTTYLLMQGALMLTFGRLGDLWGHKRVYMIGLIAFVTSSLLCGAAPSTPYLVAARGLQAVGAAMVVSNMAAIMTRIFPPEQRGKALGTQATTVYLGVATGAPLGGWLTGVLGWRSVFYVNIPFGLIALFLAWRVIKPDPSENRRETFDFAGAAVYAAGLVALLLGLNQGTSWGWSSPWTLGCLGVGLAVLACWVSLELRMANPMLDLRLFAKRTFSTPVVSSMLNYGATVSTTFLLPFALIQGRQLTPAQTGLVIMCQPITMAMAASVSGALSDKIGSRIPATVGMSCLALGLFLLSRFVPTMPVPVIAATLVITGLGIGLFTSPNNSAVMGAVPQRRRGVASGVISTARTLGNLLGIGLAGAIFSTVLATTDGGPDGVLGAASVGLLVASGIALIGAITSVTRPAPIVD